MLTVRGRRTEKHDLLQQNLCLAYVVVAADLAEEPSGVSVCVCLCCAETAAAVWSGLLFHMLPFTQML